MTTIPFNKPHIGAGVSARLADAMARGCWAGNGSFTRMCESSLVAHTGSAHALLTPSGTAALEMMALLLDIRPGDEVIMPSFTFPSSANAFVLRGGVPVFVDVRDDTLNLDERLVEDAITVRTRAILMVHYAGVACEVDVLSEIAHRRGLTLIEDAAQALGGTYRGRAAGALGALGAFSFHESKNIIAGEGGALLLNDESFMERAEIIQEKGTNRASFFRGETDSYTWLDVGSSYLMSEVGAAFLLAQLDELNAITEARRLVWERYHVGLARLEEAECVRRPFVPSDRRHNGHAYYILARDPDDRKRLTRGLDDRGIKALSHYVPLHSSPAGRRFGIVSGSMDHTDNVSARLLRLPLWPELPVDRVVEALTDLVSARHSKLRAGSET